MKVAVAYRPGEIGVEEVERPAPGPGEVLMRVRAAEICGSDLFPLEEIPPALAAAQRKGESGATKVLVTPCEVARMIDQAAEALTHLGNLALQQKNDALACELYEEGLAIWRALDDKPGIVHPTLRLERLTRKQGRTSPACHALVTLGR